MCNEDNTFALYVYWHIVHGANDPTFEKITVSSPGQSYPPGAGGWRKTSPGLFCHELSSDFVFISCLF